MQTTDALRDKVAVVTGAAGGLGRVIVLTLAGLGARVVACDVNTPGLQSLLPELQALGGAHACLPCDVSDAQAVAALFAEIDKAFGTVHILVNNAALVPGRPEDEARRHRHYSYITTPEPRQSLGFTSAMTDDEWHRYWNVNVHGVFYCTREALKRMEPQRYGRIVNIASIAGISAMSAHSPHYSATKGAVIAFSRAVAAEVAGANILVNVMAPGGVQTPTFDAMLDRMSDEQTNRLWQMIPAGRLGSMQQYADTVAFLSGDHYLVGQVISPNGGAVI